ncbi:MAG: radical SAM protein [Candidatus Nanopelagicales bacterium]
MTDDERRVLEDIKIHCLSHGVSVTDRAFDVLLAAQGILSIHEYPTTGGLTFELPHGVFVNAPFDEVYCEDAHVTVDAEGGSDLVLRLGRDVVPVVRQIPLPGYLDVIGSNGKPVTEVVMSHGDRARLSPIDGCAYDCAYCDMAELPYIMYPADVLTEALAVAEADAVLPVRHALISGGSPRSRHYEDFERLVIAVVESTQMPVDLMMSPMVNNSGFLARVKAAGLLDFSINIEVFAKEPALAALGMKYKTTRRHFADFVSNAVELTQRHGQTRSLIIAGLEDPEQTLEGVEFLASLGCLPVLSPFRPAGGTGATHLPPVPSSTLRDILDRSRDIVARYGLHLGPDCLACQHNTLNFPWDAHA